MRGLIEKLEKDVIMLMRINKTMSGTNGSPPNPKTSSPPQPPPTAEKDISIEIAEVALRYKLQDINMKLGYQYFRIKCRNYQPPSVT